MQRIIEKISIDHGLSDEQASGAYTTIVNHLISNIPELEKIVDTVFAEPEQPDLNKEIYKLVNLLQFRGMEHLKNRPMPAETHRFSLNNELL